MYDGRNQLRQIIIKRERDITTGEANQWRKEKPFSCSVQILATASNDDKQSPQCAPWRKRACYCNSFHTIREETIRSVSICVWKLCFISDWSFVFQEKADCHFKLATFKNSTMSCKQIHFPRTNIHRFSWVCSILSISLYSFIMWWQFNLTGKWQGSRVGQVWGPVGGRLNALANIICQWETWRYKNGSAL